MRDAAAAAAMSDPDNNYWFRRRWVEPDRVSGSSQTVDLASEALELTGLELLAQWRRERATPTAINGAGGTG